MKTLEGKVAVITGGSSGIGLATAKLFQEVGVRVAISGRNQMKAVVITGANVGIGFATAKFLAARPDWHAVLACRNESKANAAMDAIRRAHSNARVSFAPLDLFSSLRFAACQQHWLRCKFLPLAVSS